MVEGRVFVSSTVYDLIDLRAEVDLFLRELSLQPVLSERHASEFDVTGVDQAINLCLINLENSEVAVFILSSRYGQPVEDYSGLSVTHLEYREAVRLKKPMFFFVRDRLMANYRVWKEQSSNTTNRPTSLNPSSEFRLFMLLDEIMNDPSHQPWVDTFSDSVHLKTLLESRLKRISGKAIFRNALKSNSMPILNMIDKGIVFSEGKLEFRIGFENVGTVPAVNLRILFNPPYPYPVEFGCFGLGKVDDRTLFFSLEELAESGQVVDNELSLKMYFEYEILAGARIRDTFELRCRVRPLLYKGIRFLVKEFLGETNIFVDESLVKSIAP